jgi:hypothetical protein
MKAVPGVKASRVPATHPTSGPSKARIQDTHTRRDGDDAPVRASWIVMPALVSVFDSWQTANGATSGRHANTRNPPKLTGNTDFSSLTARHTQTFRSAGSPSMGQWLTTRRRSFESMLGRDWIRWFLLKHRSR